MWSAVRKDLPEFPGTHFTVWLNSRVLTVVQVIQSWRDDERFRTWFNDLLAGVPYAAFRWETPPVTDSTINQPFQCVLLDSPRLTQRPDVKAFAEHWRTPPKDGVVEFGNLSGDAMLVVPCPIVEPAAYVHLAAFVRKAPEAQRQALWQHVSMAMSRRLSNKPVWLSTAGAGVPWLHVRLDDRPKYYRYDTWKQ